MPAIAGPLCQVHEQHQVQHQGSRQYRVRAQEVHLQLHPPPEPPKQVDIVPALLVVSPGRIVVDSHLVIGILIQVGIQVGLQYVFQHPQLRLFLRLEILGLVQDLAVPIPKYVRREPAVQTKHPGLQHRTYNGL